VAAPSYGAYPVRTPNGTVVGYVHHFDRPDGRYRAVPRTAVDVPLPHSEYETHSAAATALMAHHYKFAS
jgi:hypothetical protein